MILTASVPFFAITPPPPPSTIAITPPPPPPSGTRTRSIVAFGTDPRNGPCRSTCTPPWSAIRHGYEPRRVRGPRTTVADQRGVQVDRHGPFRGSVPKATILRVRVPDSILRGGFVRVRVPDSRTTTLVKCSVEYMIIIFMNTWFIKIYDCFSIGSTVVYAGAAYTVRPFCFVSMREKETPPPPAPYSPVRPMQVQNSFFLKSEGAAYIQVRSIVRKIVR